jgi:Rod binding domain-containing protein
LSGGSGAAKDPRELARAAEEFESLLLAQILRMVREAGSGGWLGSSGKQGVNPAMELAEAELARALARGGALGISQLVVKDLAPSSPDESSKPGPVEGGR